MRPVDILPRDREIVLAVLRRFVSGLEVRAAGSRASGRARRHSDLDLIVMTERPLEVSVLAALNRAFSDSDLPFSVDILDWASLAENLRRLVYGGSIVIQEKS